MVDLVLPDMFWRSLGMAGFALYVLNYALLSWRLVDVKSNRFFVWNTAAASLVLASNYIDFNLASVLIQVFWIAIGLNAIILRRKSAPSEALPG